MKIQFRKRQLAVVIESLAAGMLLAACGGGTADSAQAVAQASSASDSSSATAADTASTGRETAQSAVAFCPSPLAGPKVAAIDYTRNETAARQALLAKFDIVALVLGADIGSARMTALASGIKALNPNTRVGQLVNLNTLPGTVAAGDPAATLLNEVNARNWWLRLANNTRSQPSAGSTDYNINLTAWTAANPQGRRWPQFKAQYDSTTFFKNTPQFDFALLGGTWAVPRVDADWRLIKTNQSRNDATIQSAFRNGYVAYWNSLRAVQPSLEIVGMLDNSNDLSSAEEKGQLEGAYLEGLIGQTWSSETIDGWNTMMGRYRAALKNTKAPNLVIFQAYSTSTDYATFRYGLASALLENGYFMHRSTNASVPIWFDEYSAPLGEAVDAPPTAAASNGIWRRAYANGMVLVNPQANAASITLPAGYKRIAGTQDPVTNNGAAVTTVTLAARSGLVLIKKTAAESCAATPATAPAPTPPAPAPAPAPVTAPAPAPATTDTVAKPKVGTQDYTWDVSAANQATLAKYSLVIVDKGRLRGAAGYNTFASGVKAINPNTKLGQYTALAEIPCPGTTQAASSEYSAMVQAAQAAGWYVRDATDNSFVQWTTNYGHCDMNVTQWGVRNAAGQTWAQYRWQSDQAAFFGTAPKMDIMFVDNVFETYRTPADYRRIGTNQALTDTTTQAAYRAGQVNFFNIARASVPNMGVIGGGTISLPEYAGQLNGAFLEALIGKTWSTETLQGWDAAMARYRDAMKYARTPKYVMFHIFGLPTDYATLRYGLASSLLDDGYFFWAEKTATGDTASPMKPHWFDEYDAQIGTAVDAPPVAATANGVWTRAYTHGLAVVNPQKVTATITIPAGYKRIKGVQDPVTNNGAAQGTTLTMGPRSGLLLLK